MQTVLLAWELGAGFGHVANLRRVAGRLTAHGLRCVAAVKDVVSATVLAEAGVVVMQAPAWKSARSSVTLGDRLGDAGLADPQTLRLLLEAWRSIIEHVRPDLVISDYSPAANLVARGRIPLALIGNGFTVPPAEMRAFPLLHTVTRPVWQERILLETANAVLADLRLQPLQRLPQLFSADASGVHTFPLLDPYARWRERPAQGPVMRGMPNPRANTASEILVYLSSWRGMDKPFAEALRPFAGHVRVFAAGFSDAQRERMAEWGMRLEAAPFNLEEDLATARLVVHLGSEGTAGMCVAAGVPQLVCAIDVEKELIGKALTEAGIGKFIPMYKPSVLLTEETMAALLADQKTDERAREVGETHRAKYCDADPLGDFIADCLKLLG